MEHLVSTPALLCRGISFGTAEDQPELVLRDVSEQSQNLVLSAGSSIGFTVLPGRWCLGHQLVHGRNQRINVPCPDEKEISHGTQCESCAAADQTRAMHDFHRSGRAGAGLREYLMQEHWLYIASFANGATKVGTAANPSKWRRLAEQGAVCASYVGWAADGAQIRILEDTVTRELGISQQVRAQAKVRGLLDSHTTAKALKELTNTKAAGARKLIAGLPDASDTTFISVNEDWQPPNLALGLINGWNSNALQSYPAELTSGEHGFVIESVLGQSLGVKLGSESDAFVLDATKLKGRKLRLGNFTTDSPAVQAALF